MPDSPFARGVLLLCGAYSILLSRDPPSAGALTVAGLLAVACAVSRRFRPLAFLLAGFVLVGVEAHRVVGDRLDERLAGRDLTESFRIVDFPDSAAFARPDPAPVRLVLAPTEPLSMLPGRIRVTWFAPPSVPRLGDCWRLTVRLRAPRGAANPGAFDYEAWLFRQAIGATGYVRDGAPDARCAPAPATVRLRQRLAERLLRTLPPDDATAVVLAIALGARHGISDERWRDYAVTGTSHLMAISGMHIGLAAGATYGVALVLCGVMRRRGNHRIVASVCALAAAVGYAAVSGFAVPARRATVMLALAVVGILLRRPVAPLPLLGASCLIVLSANPLDALSPGFKLSFGAVAVLFAATRRRIGRAPPTLTRRVGAGLRDLGALQVALLLGLLPLTAALFGRVSWLAPAVNALVLPVFNIATVPLALTGLAMPHAPVADALLAGARQSVRVLHAIIAAAGRLPGAELRVAELRGGIAVAAGLPLLWIVLPRGWPGRAVAALAAAAIAIYAPPRPPAGCADVHVLDVGQGLAVAVLTTRRTILLDTGPAFRSGADAGRFAVLPVLQSLGVGRLDMLVVSHADQDHAGGVRSVLAGVGADTLLVGETLDGVAQPQHRCRAGQSWHWDGVRFAVLHPAAADVRTGNNASCVIEIAAGRHRVLFTGDIEAPVERRLLQDGLLSAVDLAIIPHHGSATSSREDFVSVLGPAVAVASAGHANRWNLPKPRVLSRWRSAGATIYSTADDGALSFRLCRDGGLSLRQRHRADRRSPWHAR